MTTRDRIPTGGERITRYTAPDHEAAIQLINDLLSKDSRYDEETWPEIAEALDRGQPGGEEQ